MRIIEGFEASRPLFTRQTVAGFTAISLTLKQRLKGLFGTEDPEEAVRQIVSDVRNRGDAALFDYALKIDGIKLTSLEVTRQQVSDAYQQVDKELVSALEFAAGRIRAFHNLQLENASRSFTQNGLSQLIRPLQRVGVYAPGGTACYPSTVLMTVVPARVAGVKEVILATPPGPQGTIPAPTLVAADIAKVERVFAMGGAQAIAALAYGTQTIPNVDKICGPGNLFVMLAKKAVYGVVDIDGLQGPSEVVIIADEAAKPKYCAADLLAQAEHDTLASSILITNSRPLAEAVSKEVESQLAKLGRKAIAAESLANKGIIAVVASIDEAIELSNLYAPEHLSLMLQNPGYCVDRITNAGCVFIGGDSSVPLGDYVAGPSHALPTGGTARFSSPLNITDFIKLINLVNIDKSELEKLSQAGMTIARAEGLEAHARALEKRLEK